MPLRLRLALWYSALCMVIVSLVALLGFGSYVRGQYQILDQVLLLSANHVAAGLRNAGRSHVLEADISQLEVAFRQYGADGTLTRVSRFVPPLPAINPIAALARPSKNLTFPVDVLLPKLEPPVQIPESTTFDFQYQGGQRWRILVTEIDQGNRTLGYLEAMTPLGYLDLSVTRLGWLLFGLALLSIGGVFGLSLAMAQVALRPVNQLTQTAVEIARSKDLSRRVTEGSGRDELSLLGNTFNGMLTSLQEANEVQKRFVADASHELRAPLAIIQGNLELLHRYPQMTDTEREEIILNADREVTRLSRLVSDLLTLARSDAGLPILQVSVELETVIQEALREAKHLLRGQNLTASVQPALVLGDPDYLKQLLLILLDNAINYTPSGGSIAIRLEALSGQAIIKVIDTGIGIPPEALDRIFDRFYRADKARSPKEGGGTGLGLSIAQWITHSHLGRIAVESSVETGTIFCVELPLLANSTNQGSR